MALRPLRSSVGQRLDRPAQAFVDRGLIPASVLRYRWVRHESVADHLGRRGLLEQGRYETVHEEAVANHPLPENVERRHELPDDCGWWGYSFRDVPSRRSGETFLATLPRCRVVSYRDASLGGDFYPAVLAADSTALEMRELRFRRRHGEVLRSSLPTVHLQQATWILERVYDNHSHWLTAHLPKILLLAARGALDHVLLPTHLSSTMKASLEMLGLEPESFLRHDPSLPLEVDELTVVGTDRFRPELLRLVQQAFHQRTLRPPQRRVFISRARATRRRLVNEEELRPLLDAAGFERVVMEELPFADQVQLMRDTAVLCAPHGAGLTNMLFCEPGTHVVELADLSFPNPNFYATAAALGHPYWLLPATPMGQGHPLERDLHVEPVVLRDALARIEARQ